MSFAPLMSRSSVEVPSDEEAAALAEQVLIGLLGSRRAGTPHAFSLLELVERAGFVVTISPLDATAGGTQALMAPYDGSFVFVVDPAPTPAEAVTFAERDHESLSQLLIDRRLAHELAHTLFYGSNGRRLRQSDPAEEQFCDVFAEHLIPDTAPAA